MYVCMYITDTYVYVCIYINIWPNEYGYGYTNFDLWLFSGEFI